MTVRFGVLGICVALALGGSLQAEVTITERFRLTSGTELQTTPRQVTYDADIDTMIVITADAAYLIPRDQLSRPPGEKLEPTVVAGSYTALPGGGVLAARVLPAAPAWFAVSKNPPRVLEVMPGDDQQVPGSGFGQKVRLLGEPLDTPDGIAGRWRWTFAGTVAPGETAPVKVVTNGRPLQLYSPNSESVVLADQGRAVLYNSAGVARAEVAGRFRFGAVSRKRKVLVLNDDQNIRRVVIKRTGQQAPKEVDAGGAVLGLCISPSGEHALLWFIRGWVRELHTRSRRLGERFRPPGTDDAYVSSCLIDNRGISVVGLLLRSAPGQPYDTGRIMVARNGRVLAELPHSTVAVSAAVPEVQPLDVRDQFAVRDLEGVTIYAIER
jgi:hypothetical protein